MEVPSTLLSVIAVVAAFALVAVIILDILPWLRPKSDTVNNPDSAKSFY
jgi:tellurite resistance protein TehA-like permease